MEQTDYAYITAITSLITALAAIFAPIVTTTITTISANRMQKYELFFQSKSASYSRFWEVVYQYASDPDSMKLLSAAADTDLYSSAETRQKIHSLTKVMIDFDVRNSSALAKCKEEAAEAMRKDLYAHKK